MRHLSFLTLVSLISFTAVAHTRTDPPPIHELALAQEVPAEALDAGVTVTLSADPSIVDIGQVARLASELDKTGVAGILSLIAASVILVARLLTRFGSKLPGAVGVWLATPTATWILPQVLSIAGALLTALASGQPVTLTLILGALGIGLMGGGVGAAGAKEAQIKKADAAGELAAAGVNSKAGTVSVLAKGPPA